MLLRGAGRCCTHAQQEETSVTSFIGSRSCLQTDLHVVVEGVVQCVVANTAMPLNVCASMNML